MISGDRRSAEFNSFPKKSLNIRSTYKLTSAHIFKYINEILTLAPICLRLQLVNSLVIVILFIEMEMCDALIISY